MLPQKTLLTDRLSWHAAFTETGCAYNIRVVGALEPHYLPTLKSDNSFPGDLNSILPSAYKTQMVLKDCLHNPVSGAMQLD